MTRTRTPAETRALDQFTSDARDLDYTLAHNDGPYRHLRLDGIMSHTSIITWPGHLWIGADHGAWTFARTDDMLRFFHHADPTYINPGYWGEKLQGGPVSGNCVTEEYDEDTWRTLIRQHSGHDHTGLDDDDQALLTAAIDALLDRHNWDYPGAHAETATHATRNFKARLTADKTWHFTDSWEWNLNTPSHHFLWTCYALQHATHLYYTTRR